MNTLDESKAFEKNGIAPSELPVLELACEYSASAVLNLAGVEIHCLHLFNVDGVFETMENLNSMYEKDEYFTVKILERPRGKMVKYVSTNLHKIVSFNRSNTADFVTIVMK